MHDSELIYPLEERIGDPRLMVGRTKEFTEYERWISRMPRKSSKSRVIMARKKSGKTAFVQRLYNRTWQANGQVVPFFIEIKEARIWQPDLAMNYYRTFASQYISFLERDPMPVRNLLKPDEIRDYGRQSGIEFLESFMDELEENRQKRLFSSMWYAAIGAPQAFASQYNRPVAVMIDEFQNLGGYVCTDEERNVPDETVPGTFHDLSESKVAPMLATGSAIGWLDKILNKYLEFGRLSPMPFSPCLSLEEGLETVYRYADYYKEPITNETAPIINELCGGDPYFIACVFRSNCPDPDLTTPGGVARTIEFETSNERAELFRGWKDWFRRALPRINQYHGKRILVYLSRNTDVMLNATELKETLKINLELDEIKDRLEKLHDAELLRNSWSRYGGLEDGTFYLLLQRHLEEEMASLDLEPDPTIEERVKTLMQEKQALLASSTTPRAGWPRRCSRLICTPVNNSGLLSISMT